MKTQFQQRQFIHMKRRFYRRDLSDKIGDARERLFFLCSFWDSVGSEDLKGP